MKELQTHTSRMVKSGHGRRARAAVPGILCCPLRVVILASVLQIVLLAGRCAHAQTTDRPDTLAQYGKGSNIILDFYQQFLSPVKGGNNCPMYPACSQYSKILFAELPFHEAFLGTFDRLLRCGHDLDNYSRIRFGADVKWYDRPRIVRQATLGFPLRERRAPPGDLRNMVDENLSRGFAAFLFENGEYRRALTEYWRAYYNSSSTAGKAEALRMMGLCYYGDADYPGYASFLETNREFFRDDENVRLEMEIVLSKCYYRTKQYGKAIDHLRRLGLYRGLSHDDESAFFQALSYARMSEWDQSATLLTQIESGSARWELASLLRDTLRTAGSVSTREPWLAGALSAVVPGAGYVYAGHARTGITSLILNSLFVWAFRDALKQESYGLASVVGFIGLGWYFGNITGSIQSAHESNERARNEFLDGIIRGEDY